MIRDVVESRSKFLRIDEQYFDGTGDDADDGESNLIFMMDFEPNKTKWLKWFTVSVNIELLMQNC